MVKKEIFSVTIVGIYILVYCLLVLAGGSAESYAVLMMVFSPILILWMIYRVMKYGKYHGPDLENEEFGYQDKNKDELGIF